MFRNISKNACASDTTVSRTRSPSLPFGIVDRILLLTCLAFEVSLNVFGSEVHHASVTFVFLTCPPFPRLCQCPRTVSWSHFGFWRAFAVHFAVFFHCLTWSHGARSSAALTSRLGKSAAGRCAATRVAPVRSAGTRAGRAAESGGKRRPMLQGSRDPRELHSTNDVPRL